MLYLQPVNTIDIYCDDAFDDLVDTTYEDRDTLEHLKDSESTFIQ